VNKPVKLIVSVAFFAGICTAQPVVTSALNAASYMLPDLPNAGIARGSMFVIFGQRLGPAAIQTVSSFPLPLQLGGTSVKVTVSGTTVDAYMVYSLATQVAAILPSSTPQGSGTITVTFSGQTSAPAPIRVVNSAFGVFAVNQAGSGPGIVQNVNSESDRPVNALTRPARPGQTVILWGTGLGPTSANEAAGPVPGDLPISVEVFVGGRSATITYKGRSGCCAGIDQIVFTTPQDVSGCYVPVVVKTGDVVSNFTTMSIGTGNVCRDEANLNISSALGTGNYSSGIVSLSRTALKFSVPQLGDIESKTDSGFATFTRFNLDQLLASSGRGSRQGDALALGSCIVSTFAGSSTTEPVDPIQPQVLDAGPAISITGPKGTKTMTRQTGGFYSAQLGGGTAIPIPGVPQQGEPEYLDPGSYSINNGSGGADVGAFTATINLTAPLTWANFNDISAVTRSAGQTITWTGGDPNGFVSIVGGSNSGTVAGSFACLERTSAGRFAIPSYVLLSLPASGSNPGTLGVFGINAIVSFTARGLDEGRVISSSGSTKSVTYR
jgi:uncharacterized protein (TIGR03437 family)